MNIAVDCETRGLDATQFVAGCIVREGYVKEEIYYDKKELWDRIIELGKSESKRKKMLNVYAHNHNFDFHAYADLDDSNIKYFSLSPFIVSYNYYGKEIIKFLDTMSLYRMSLKNLGEMIGMKKGELPEEFKEKAQEIPIEELRNMIRFNISGARDYLIQDTRITLKSIELLREKMNKDGISVMRLFTINQVAINYLVNELRKEKVSAILNDFKAGRTHDTYRATEIHSAYKGGRVEAFKTGIIDDVTYIDCNSLYPYSLINIRIPDLRSERKTWQPLEYMDEDMLLDKIGIARAMMKNRSCEYGLLATRTPNMNHYPKIGKYLIGTWTHDEIKKAMAEGYQLIDIEWSVHFKDAENPFTKIIKRLYAERVKSHNEFNSYFYKMMMNASIGKMAQTKVNQELVIDSIEKAEEYLSNNYKIIKGMEYNMMYQKTDTKDGYRKKYYMPIIPCLVNAYARMMMYDNFKKIPLKDLVYTDTDSIMFKGDHIGKFDISREMGQFKVEGEHQRAVIYGKKTYKYGSEIKISGISKKDVKPEDFETGYVTSYKMLSIKSTTDISQAGKFVKERRDLNKQLENFVMIENKMDEPTLYVDSDIEDIQFFLQKIEGIR